MANLSADDRSVLVLHPALAEELENLIEFWGLDLVKDALEEWIEENEGD